MLKCRNCIFASFVPLSKQVQGPPSISLKQVVETSSFGGDSHKLQDNYWQKAAAPVSRVRIKVRKMGITGTHLHLGRQPKSPSPPLPRYPSAPVHNTPSPQTAASLSVFAISGNYGGQLTVTPPAPTSSPPPPPSPCPSPTNSLITAHSPKCVCNVGNHFQ